MTMLQQQLHRKSMVRGPEMNLRKGQRVSVNLTAFIGGVLPSTQSVECRVVDVRSSEIQVCPEPPCRQVALWTAWRWIEGIPG
jgi:hypothetical protein